MFCALSRSVIRNVQNHEIFTESKEWVIEVILFGSYLQAFIFDFGQMLMNIRSLKNLQNHENFETFEFGADYDITAARTKVIRCLRIKKILQRNSYVDDLLDHHILCDLSKE